MKLVFCIIACIEEAARLRRPDDIMRLAEALIAAKGNDAHECRWALYDTITTVLREIAQGNEAYREEVNAYIALICDASDHLPTKNQSSSLDATA